MLVTRRIKAGRHQEKRLTAVGVRAIKMPGRHADGQGLYLQVDESGAKRWLLRIVVQGRRRDIGLGGLSTVPLAAAREEAARMRQIARGGGDPLAQRRLEQRVVLTFEEAARQVHTARLPSWKNKKHGDQWINSLTTYVFPVFGKKPVDQIETPDILGVLSPIWLSKAETARRVRQRIGDVMNWAKAHDLRDGVNPVDGVENALPKQPERLNHHEALPFAEVPAFVTGLRTCDSSELTKLAFEFLILTATRTNEVLGAKWSEIDEKNALWIIPGERMKAQRPHRVPLSVRCVEILKRAKPLAGGSDYIFPGRNGKSSLSNMAFMMVLRRMGLQITAHGFRSSFRDWAGEKTSFPGDVAEMALAHVIKNKVEAAYRRGDLLEKRRQLMEAWADYVNGQKPQRKGVNGTRKAS